MKTVNLCNDVRGRFILIYKLILKQLSKNINRQKIRIISREKQLTNLKCIYLEKFFVLEPLSKKFNKYKFLCSVLNQDKITSKMYTKRILLKSLNIYSKLLNTARIYVLFNQ